MGPVPNPSSRPSPSMGNVAAVPNSPTMGMRGPTLSFGGGSPTRQYTPNPFVSSAPKPLPGGSAGFAPSQQTPLAAPGQGLQLGQQQRIASLLRGRM